MSKKPIESRPGDRTKLAEAARTLFRAKGYEAAGMREIATAAGVNVSIAMREYGGKAGLFRHAIALDLDLGDTLRGTRGLWGASLADLALKGEWAAHAPAALSTGNPHAARVLAEEWEAKLVRPLAAALGGAEADERARLILATMAGFATGRETLGMSPGNAAASAVIQALIDDQS